MKIVKFTLALLLFCFLTILTQVGGFVYLLSKFTYKLTDSWARNRFLKATYRFMSFLILYCLTTFFLVPILAKPLGRVPLPLIETNNLRPLNSLTFLLNRNYVRPELRQTVYSVAKQLNEKFPGYSMKYMDANFPFIYKFPLLPHLSHNDGKKLDLAFFYLDAKTGEQTNERPSFIGYGFCEAARSNEKNTAELCEGQGYWQYTFMSKVISQDNKKDFTFDGKRTKELINLFAKQKTINKIFLEPHLKTRLNLTSDKIRFHGCESVRHDDHVHIQLK